MNVGGRVAASRTFDQASQEEFAAFSGDLNPIHMDALASRRSPAGKPVVHGMHIVLWSLDALAQQGPLPRGDVQLNVTFLRWAYIGDIVTVALPRHGSVEYFRLQVNGLTIATAEWRRSEPATLPHDTIGPSRQDPLEVPSHLPLNEIQGLAGDAYCGAVIGARRLFPALSEVIGPNAVVELAATSYTVGMLVPGLYSMYSKLGVRIATPNSLPPALTYRVARVDERFRKVSIDVSGNAIDGTVKTFMRQPPVRQPSLSELSRVVQPGEFAHIQALITGGSRGLGALAANIIAAGGGSVTVTYASGLADAELIVAELYAAGRRAHTVRYDAREPVEILMSSLPCTPTHLFHFATPTINVPRQELFSLPLLEQFLTFYVTSFYSLCTALVQRRATESESARLYAFYPSTVFLEERPPGMVEYAMAKAAGEQLCAELNLRTSGVEVLVARLPKLLTDQTAGIVPENITDSVATLLPLIRQMPTP